MENPALTIYQGGANASIDILGVGHSTASGGQVTMQWSSVKGGRHTIESSPDVSAWTNAQTNIPGSGFATQRTIGTGGADRRFYKVRRDSIDPCDTVDTP